MLIFTHFFRRVGMVKDLTCFDVQVFLFVDVFIFSRDSDVKIDNY